MAFIFVLIVTQKEKKFEWQVLSFKYRNEIISGPNLVINNHQDFRAKNLAIRDCDDGINILVTNDPGGFKMNPSLARRFNLKEISIHDLRNRENLASMLEIGQCDLKISI